MKRGGEIDRSEGSDSVVDNTESRNVTRETVSQKLRES